MLTLIYSVEWCLISDSKQYHFQCDLGYFEEYMTILLSKVDFASCIMNKGNVEVFKLVNSQIIIQI